MADVTVACWDIHWFPIHKEPHYKVITAGSSTVVENESKMRRKWINFCSVEFPILKKFIISCCEGLGIFIQAKCSREIKDSVRMAELKCSNGVTEMKRTMHVLYRLRRSFLLANDVN